MIPICVRKQIHKLFTYLTFVRCFNCLSCRIMCLNSKE
uniref:Uncharacterized protein n=1 Tax=Rhizophora mucronata TaxID=61149 RepID=A0A2P2L190_RHIMU